MKPAKLVGALEKKFRGWLPRVDLATSGPSKTRLDVKTKVTLGVAGIVAVMSVFFMVVGVPVTYAGVSEQCSLGSPCVQTQQSETYFMQVPAAIVPLLSATIIGIGLLKRSKVLSWVGIAALSAFSFVGMFSIGPLYLPLVALAVFATATLNGDRPRVES